MSRGLTFQTAPARNWLVSTLKGENQLSRILFSAGAASCPALA